MSELGWPDQLENGELLANPEQSRFDLLVTSDQIRYQQNIADRNIALLILGSNIWPIVRTYAAAIRAGAQAAKPGTYLFIEMPRPSTPRS